MSNSLPLTQSQCKHKSLTKKLENMEGTFITAIFWVAIDFIAASCALLANFFYEDQLRKFSASTIAITCIVLGLLITLVVEIFLHKCLESVNKKLSRRLSPIAHVLAFSPTAMIAVGVLSYEYMHGSRAGMFWTALHCLIVFLFLRVCIQIYFLKRKIEHCELVEQPEEIGRLMDELMHH